MIGDYWIVYPVNFLSHERVLGARRSRTDLDSYAIAKRLDGLIGPWALASWWPWELRDLVRRAGVPGKTLEAAPGVCVFLPAEGVSASEALARLRRTP